MKNKILAVLTSATLFVGLPVFAFADTPFGTSTVSGTINSLIFDLAVIIGLVGTSLLGLWVALIGLGWGIGRFKKYIAGRKF